MTIEIPKSIHLSLEGHDPGEMLFLFTGDDSEGSIVGEVYNFDDFPCLEEDQLGEVDAMAIATAKKLVLAYNAYDEMLAALKANHEWHLMYDDSGSYHGS